MFEDHFLQFVAECCNEVKRSPSYIKAEAELRAAIDAIAAKLGSDDKHLANGRNGLTDLLAAVEAAVEDDHFKAGFLAGVRLGNE